MSFTLLLIAAAAAYILWFHKFTMPDGTEVKGWLEKHKREKEEAEQVPEDVEYTEVGQEEEEEPANEADAVADEEEPEDAIPSDAVGLGINSTTMDFDEVLDEAQDDLFGKAWKDMEAYYGWLLIGACRTDIINNEMIWPMIANAYVRNRTNLELYFREKAAAGDEDPKIAKILPAWFANVHLLNGFNPFIAHAQEYFDAKTWHRLEGRIDAWREDLTAARNRVPNDENKRIYDEPNAVQYLIWLYTILQDQDSSQILPNREWFEQTFDFDYVLPTPPEA